jgi:hypothetical protein
MLLMRFEREACAPPEKVLSRLSVDVKSPCTPPGTTSYATGYVMVGGRALLYRTGITPRPFEPLYGYVEADSFRVWSTIAVVELRGSIFPSAKGSRIVGQLCLRNVAVVSWTLIGRFSCIYATVRPVSLYWGTDMLSPMFFGEIWLACLVPLCLLILTASATVKRRLMHSIDSAEAEYRLHVDSEDISRQ